MTLTKEEAQTLAKLVDIALETNAKAGGEIFAYEGITQPQIDQLQQDIRLAL